MAWVFMYVATVLSMIPTIVGAPDRDPAWIDALKGDGYLVGQGKWGYFDLNTCAHSDTCYAINPITPYGLIYMPPHANETNDWNYTNSCHKHKLCMIEGDKTFSPGWRVAPGEVIVLVGLTPPESTYWSFAPSLYTRFHEGGYKPSPKGLSQKIVACPSYPEGSAGGRCEIFSSVNDPLNMETVSVRSPTPFNTSFAMILSWDAEVEEEVARHLEDSGVGPVNYLRYPGAISRLGVTTGKEDEFIQVMRVEDIARQADADAFYRSNPYQVYRVSRTLDNPPAKTRLHESFDGRMRTRWTGVDESAPNVTNAELRDGLAQLKKLIIRENSHFMDYTSQDFASFVNDSGYQCLDNGLQCQGDCRDTIYARATMLVQESICNKTHLPCQPSRKAELTSETSDAFFVAGVNHKMTNQSRYSSITAYNFPKLASGILKTEAGKLQYTMMDNDYKSSAVKHLPNHPAAPYLYVVKFARKCSSDESFLCVELPSHSDNVNITAISEPEPIVFIERMYIHPGTHSGPFVAETVLPVLLHFRKRFGDDALPEMII